MFVTNRSALSIICLYVFFFSPSLLPKYTTLTNLCGKTAENVEDNSCQNKNQVHLSAAEKLNLIEELFGKRAGSELIDEQGIESLELEEVCSALANPQTIFGKKQCNDLFLSPTLDQDVLKSRSGIIQALCKDEQLRQELDNLYANIAQSENELLKFFLAEDEIAKKTIAEFYFGGSLDFLNKNSTALEGRRLGAYAWHGLSLVPPTVFGVIVGGLTQYAYISILGKMLKNENLSLEQRYTLQSAYDVYCQQFKSIGYKDIPGKLNFLYSLPFKAVSSAYKSLISAHNPMKSKTLEQRNNLATFGDQFDFFKNFKEKSFNGANTNVMKAGVVVGWTMQSAMDAWCIQRLKSSKKALEFREEIVHSIQSQMHSLSILYNALNDITISCEKNPEIAEHFEQLSPLVQFCRHAEELSQQLNSLLRLLTSSSLKNAPTYFSNQGKALAAYRLMQETKEMWIPALKALGECEVYLEIAKKVSSGEMCFASEVIAGGPHIEAYRCRNPRVADDHGQDFLMGSGTHARNLLITGPHGGGKSVGQKAIVYNILAAMTFKVAWAESFIYTPVDKIFVYCNVKENLKEGLSAFMAECARIDEIESELMDMGQGKKALILTDEVFKGTMEAEGAKRYSDFCKKISEYDNALLIAITHFEELTELESKTQGMIKNYQIELLMSPDGSFERTYRLRPGKPDWWFNNEEQRSQYIDWIRKQH